MDAVERKGVTFLRVGGMASVEEAISVLGDAGQALGRRCLAAKAIYLLGDLEQRGVAVSWVWDPVLGTAILWAHRRRFERRRRQGAMLGEWLTVLAGADESEEFREAARRIGSLGFRRATRPVMRVVREAAEPGRRAAALHALWLLGDRRATPLLLRVATDKTASEEEVRIALEALGAGSMRLPVQRTLANRLGDPSPAVRYSALCAVGAAWADGRQMGAPLREALRRATIEGTGEEARLAGLLLKAPAAGEWTEEFREFRLAEGERRLSGVATIGARGSSEESKGNIPRKPGNAA